MTEQEAIEELEERYLTMSMCGDVDECRRNNLLISMAISALEKRIPKKPKKQPDKYYGLVQYYHCPSCGRYFGQSGVHNVILFNKERYCQGDGCGQAIDWSEE